jgi:hypothetical protein
VNSSKTLDKTESCDIDTQSFIQETKTSGKNDDGIGQIKGIISVDSDKGQDIIERSPLDDVCQIFEIKKLFNTQKEYLIVKEEGMDFIKQWTGRNQIEKWAGQFIPMSSLTDNINTVHMFEDLQKEADIQDIKYLYDKNCIKYEDGEWTSTIKWNNYNTIISVFQSIISFIALIFATLGVIFLTVGNSSIIYLSMMLLWMLTLGTQIYLSKLRTKPTKLVLENLDIN